jgi:hypothetical protein
MEMMAVEAMAKEEVKVLVVDQSCDVEDNHSLSHHHHLTCDTLMMVMSLCGSHHPRIQTSKENSHRCFRDDDDDDGGGGGEAGDVAFDAHVDLQHNDDDDDACVHFLVVVECESQGIEVEC